MAVVKLQAFLNYHGRSNMKGINQKHDGIKSKNQGGAGTGGRVDLRTVKKTMPGVPKRETCVNNKGFSGGSASQIRMGDFK